MISAATTGFAIGFSLILAIGAQNAYVLRMGLMQSHVFWVCLTCALSDAILISIGVAGITGIARSAPWIIPALTWGGAAFLIFYGLLSLKRATEASRLVAAEAGNGSLRRAVLTCLALAWLNPHVYLDTVGLIGAVSTKFDDSDRKIAYAAGAAAASFVFFFSLGYGARLLAPIFARPRSWAVLEALIAVIMFAIAGSLIFGVLGA